LLSPAFIGDEPPERGRRDEGGLAHVLHLQPAFAPAASCPIIIQITFGAMNGWLRDVSISEGVAVTARKTARLT